MCRQHSFECGVHLLKSDGTFLESGDKDMELNISSATDSTCSIEAPAVYTSFTKQVTSTVDSQNSSLNCIVDSGYHSWSNIDCSKEVHESDVASQSVDDEKTMQATDVTTLQCNNILNSFDKINPATCHNCCLLSKEAASDTASACITENLESYHEAQNSVYSKVVDNNANHIHQSKVSQHHEPAMLKSPSKNGVCKSCSNGIHLFASVATAVQYQNGHNNIYQDPSYVCTTAPSHCGAVKPHVLMNGQSRGEYKTDVQDLAIKIEFCLMFGFTASQIRAAIMKLSCSASKNDILAELSSMQSAPAISTSTSLPLMNHAYNNTFDGHNFESECEGEGALGRGPDFSSDEALRARGPLSIENEHKDNDEEKTSDEDHQNLRPIVIDGSNVAMSHGNKQYFSCKGILLAVDFFRQRNHTDITVFVPTYRKESRRPDVPTRGREILAKLEEERILVYTPSRWINGKRVTCYDDRFILKLAQDTGGIVVSNDHFRDLQNEKPEWKELVDKRLLMYSFASDRFMAPDDPLGKNGPSIDNFLRKRPASEEQYKPQCPYGPKCTYGRKCKYFHPECARSVTDGFKKSEKRVKASNTAKQLAHELFSSSKNISPKTKALKQSPSKVNDQGLPSLADDGRETEPRDAVSSPGIKLDDTRQSQTGVEGEQMDHCYMHNSANCDQHHLPHVHVQNNRRPISSRSTQEPVMSAPYPQYQSSCDGLCDSLAQKLTVSGQLSGQRAQMCPCRHNCSLSNALCYDLQRQMYPPMVNEQLQAHNSFSNSRMTSQQYLYTEAGPPDFHADHSSVKKPLISQANGQHYQRSSPANLHIYDGRHPSSVIHPQHMNMTASYQRAPSMHAPYGMYSQPVFRAGYGDAQYQPNHHQSMPQQLMYPYPMSGNTQSAPRMHQSMGPGPYFVSSLNPSTGSDNSVSHTYPFLAAPDGQAVTPVQKNISSPNNSDAKTYPPPRMTRRVYSSPGHQGMPNMHQGHNSPPHHNNLNYSEVHRQQLHHRLQHVPCGSPPLNSPENPRHHLFQNLCGLLDPHVVKKVMTAHPKIREPKVLIELCLKESD